MRYAHVPVKQAVILPSALSLMYPPESIPDYSLRIIREYRKPDQRVFVGVTAPVDPHIETPEEVRDRSFEPGNNRRWC
jgi:hypothetical protein